MEKVAHRAHENIVPLPPTSWRIEVLRMKRRRNIHAKVSKVLYEKKVEIIFAYYILTGKAGWQCYEINQIKNTQLVGNL